MSTVSTMADVQNGREVVPSDVLRSQRSEIKFSAAQIEMDCPTRLQEIGKEITERFEEAREQTRRLDDHVIAINKLIAEAQELCDVGGYNKFRELFCPQLGKSQAYVRLSISAGKTTLVEHRAKERERKKKTRAVQRATASNSGTVPEKPRPQGALKELREIEAPSIASQQTPEPAKPRSPVTPGDEGTRAFTEQVMELDRGTAEWPPERFSGTAVSADFLVRLGNRLIDIAKHKKIDAVEATPAEVVRGTVPDEQPTGDIKAERPVRDAEELRP